MLEKLKQRWNVGGWGLFLIITTFALGGSACARIGSKILALFNIEKGLLWTIAYVFLISLLWPLCVLVISIPLGQFSFFKNYLLRVFRRLAGNRQEKQNSIAIFASGTGTNAENIIRFFEKDQNTIVGLVVCNNKKARVNEIAKKLNVPLLEIGNDDLANPKHLIETLQSKKISFIVLAGFLKKIPSALVEAFPKKIINIHPALLPKYGGKGMYGVRVHDSVISNGEVESGITIHYVDDVYDNGEMIFQKKCEVSPNDTAETLAQKVHSLEYEYYPKMIKKIIDEQNHR